MAVPISLQDEIASQTAEDLRERYDLEAKRSKKRIAILTQGAGETTAELEVVGENVATIEENIDSITQTISEAVTQIDTNTNQIVSNVTNISTLTQNINGLTLNQQKSGGANILENSAKIFDNNDSYWTYSSGYNGYTSLDTSNESVSGRLQYLGSGWEQIYHPVPNNAITVSFYYKKLASSTATVQLSDNTAVTLGNETEWTLYEEHLTITLGQISIKFTCDTLNGYVYRDLMVNFGNVAIPWTQSLNETITETVKIGGAAVEVISDTSETKSKMSAASGFQVLDKVTGEEITVFDREGMITKRGQFSSKVEVGKLRILPISDTLIGFSIND